MSTPADLCFYVPGKPGIVDIVTVRDGVQVGGYSGRSLDQLREEYPGAVVATLSEAHQASLAMMRSEPVEITRDEFLRALECLPPVGWSNLQGESFRLSECTYGPITSIYVHLGKRYFSFNDNISTPHAECVRRVKEAFKL